RERALAAPASRGAARRGHRLRDGHVCDRVRAARRRGTRRRPRAGRAAGGPAGRRGGRGPRRVVRACGRGAAASGGRQHGPGAGRGRDRAPGRGDAGVAAGGGRAGPAARRPARAVHAVADPHLRAVAGQPADEAGPVAHRAPARGRARGRRSACRAPGRARRLPAVPSTGLEPPRAGAGPLGRRAAAPHRDRGGAGGGAVSTRRRQVPLRSAQLLAVLVVSWALFRMLGIRLSELESLRATDWRPAAAPLALSTAVLLAMYLAHALLWRTVMTDIGVGRPTIRTTIRLYFLASLGRYVPGKFWQVAGIAVLSNRAGLSPVGATAAALLGQLAFLLSGALFLAIAMPTGRGAAAAAAG